MEINVGNTDRIIRIIVGLGLASLLFLLEGNARWFGLIGIALLATALTRRCPAYWMLGLNSCPAQSKE